MSRRNYWTTLRQRKISRRTMLGASAKAGVGAAGLALVGCGDDDEPDAGAAAAERAAAAAEEAAAAAVAAGDARAADSAAAAAVAAAAADAAAEAADAAGEASDAAAQAAAAAADAAALAAEAAESEDAANAAAAAEAAAAAAAQAADAASAAGDAAAAAVADAAAQAAEAAAQAARDAAAAVEAGTATAAAAQAAINAAAEAAAAAAAAAGEASAAAGAAAATAQQTAEAAAETAAAAVAAAQEAADAAQEAAESAAMAAEEDDMGAAAGEIDTEATLRLALAADNGGLDPHRSGSQVNYQNSHGVFERSVTVDPETGNPAQVLLQWELPDEVTWNFTVKDGVYFHNGTKLTAADIIFTHERVGGIAEYNQGGETSDHPGGWASARTPFGAQKWASYGQTDDLHWTLTSDGPDATIPGSALTIPYVMSKADTEERGDAAVDAEPMGSGYMRFVSHAEDTDFVMERNDDYHIPWSSSPTPIASASYKRQVHLVRPEPLSRIAGIEAGELDVAYALTPDVAEPIMDDPDFNVGSGWAGNPNQYLMANWLIDELNGGPNPFRDERVRKALNHAINKQAIIDNLMTGDEKTSYGAWAASAFYPKEALEAIGPYAYDPELAKALLAEAGYPDGFKTPFHFSADYIATDPAVALVLQQDLGAVGVELELRSYPTSEFFATARNKEEPGLYFMQLCACYEPDIMIGGHIAPTAGDTFALQPSPELDDLRTRTRTAIDPDERAAAIEELYVRHYQMAGFIYLTERFQFHATAANVEWPLGAAQLADMHSIWQINVRAT